MDLVNVTYNQTGKSKSTNQYGMREMQERAFDCCEAHRQNDIIIEKCYRSTPFTSDEERLEYLFKLYEKMIAEEQENGTLFAKEKKSKKSKKE